MIFDSEKIVYQAQKFRAKMEEIEAQVVEDLVSENTFEAIAERREIPLSQVLDICRSPRANTFFWMLVALVNTQEAESDSEVCGGFKEVSANQSKSFDVLAGARTLH